MAELTAKLTLTLIKILCVTRINLNLLARYLPCHRTTAPSNGLLGNVYLLKCQDSVFGVPNMSMYKMGSSLNLVRCVSQDSGALEDLQNDAGACIKELLYTESDLTVTPIMDNPKVCTML